MIKYIYPKVLTYTNNELFNKKAKGMKIYMQEFENKQEKNEKIIDIKGTLEDFIEEEKPELSQEEAIKAYKEGDIIAYPKKRKKYLKRRR